MSHRKFASALVLSVSCAMAQAHAQSPTQPASSSSLVQTGFPNVSTISAANAAGLLSYCVKNKHLATSRANPVLHGLMNKPGLSSSSGYTLGQQGRIISAHKRPMAFTEIPQNRKGQACEAVLKRGSTVLAQPQPSTASRPTFSNTGSH